MRVAGIAAYAPKNVFSNDDVARMLQTAMAEAEERRMRLTGGGLTDDEKAQFKTSDRWIQRFIGFKSRRFASPGEGTIDLAERASKNLIAGLNLDVAQIDGIVFGTVTPSYKNSPPDANLLQYRLKIPTQRNGRANCVFGLDSSLACCTWVESLSFVYALIRSGLCRCVLLVGADAMSTTINWKDRAFATVLGDAGTATLCVAVPDEQDWFGSKRFFSYMDGQHWEAILTPKGGSKNPISSGDDIIEQLDKLGMNGPLVKDLVLSTVGGQMMDDVLEQTGWGYADLDLVSFHEANLAQLVRPIVEVWRTKGFTGEVLDAGGEFANTTSASVPLALAKNGFKLQPVTSPPKKLALGAMGGSLTAAFAFCEIKHELPTFVDV
ncbi:MAG: 3-oxoacyl-[acyl-carrier-protein] synthase III [Parcubacteria group bacterium Gr01-1014_20]|nr:MAG: 3-oxoacyl-[acyl-carrier-protein] synthase III [Parcubacteria group bacterium Gr01-1014_20]